MTELDVFVNIEANINPFRLRDIFVMLIGYMRVSTNGQSLDLQEDALRQGGCEKIFKDVAGGAKADRSGLDECLAYLRDGEDTLVVWKSDRLGRSLHHLIEIIESLKTRRIGFKSLTEGLMDTTTADGALVFGFFALLAQHERSRLQERTVAGLDAARARGRMGGRPVKLTDEKKQLARTLLQDPSYTIKNVSRHLGVSPSTLYHFHAELQRQAKTVMATGNAGI